MKYELTYYTPFASGGENPHSSKHGSLDRLRWAMKQAPKNRGYIRMEVRKYNECTGEYEPFHIPKE